MSILAWIVLGLVAGFIASKLVNRNGGGLVLDLVLGIVGAVVGGFVFNQFGSSGVSGFNLYSLLVATIGAVIVLAIYHMLTGRRAV
ncbi:GlsB/YeaQ/YmgE family stress response membrane protein [Caulobacter sp. DWR1-3-2b1]|uniref:GlsB/YeaQ/YmgE family stress response membrane protein n=1 Tax=Caulobacter sp. DWR1-3-2b1 TaxID=2804670 RepID=UPI003CFBA231